MAAEEIPYEPPTPQPEPVIAPDPLRAFISDNYALHALNSVLEQKQGQDRWRQDIHATYRDMRIYQPQMRELIRGEMRDMKHKHPNLTLETQKVIKDSLYSTYLMLLIATGLDEGRFPPQIDSPIKVTSVLDGTILPKVTVHARNEVRKLMHGEDADMYAAHAFKSIEDYSPPLAHHIQHLLSSEDIPKELIPDVLRALVSIPTAFAFADVSQFEITKGMIAQVAAGVAGTLGDIGTTIVGLQQPGTAEVNPFYHKILELLPGNEALPGLALARFSAILFGAAVYVWSQNRERIKMAEEDIIENKPTTKLDRFKKLLRPTPAKSMLALNLFQAAVVAANAALLAGIRKF